VPLFPDDLVARLLPHAEHAPAFAIDSEGIAHGACAIWPVGLADALETKLRAGLRKVMQFHALVAGFGVRFDANDRHRFLNINTPHDLAVATVLLRELDGGLTSS
jgi:molybdopterin-guanine dinucleotide biosynthesis protein A